MTHDASTSISLNQLFALQNLLANNCSIFEFLLGKPGLGNKQKQYNTGKLKESFGLQAPRYVLRCGIFSFIQLTKLTYCNLAIVFKSKGMLNQYNLFYKTGIDKPIVM